ncbi:unnamed protein product [Schistosoma mattheei]|uniref:TLC domain-containing protein n=1 Tax=Schistosoma mattheei TaxID=31246 RepID=A0A3P7XIC9_9TREM|nr:unnamed protein product [Schistosoma mattheei]
MATEVLFYIFVPVWIVTRLTYFPLWVIWATFKFSIFVNGPYPAVLIMVGFLLVLQILHIYWFCLIVKIAIQVKSNGRVSSICYFFFINSIIYLLDSVSVINFVMFLSNNRITQTIVLMI